jgi:hypothetical protein
MNETCKNRKKWKTEHAQAGLPSKCWTSTLQGNRHIGIKYRTWSYKKMKKKKTLVKVEEFKMHQWQHSAG